MILSKSLLPLLLTNIARINMEDVVNHSRVVCKCWWMGSGFSQKHALKYYYRTYCKYSDRQACANTVDPDEMSDKR